MSVDFIENNREESPFDDWWFNEVSFEALFKKLYPHLCVYCRLKYGFDIALAEDIVNTSFTKLWNARHSIASEVAAKAYVYKVVDNSSLNQVKHQKIKRRHEQYIFTTTQESVSHQTFDSVDLKELRAKIDMSISELPEQMRKIFELSRFGGKKYAEIATELNISVKTVETQISRAMAKLREKLSQYLLTLVILIFNYLILR